MRDYEVVVNDCAAPPVPGIVHIRTRETQHGKPNFTFNYDKVVEGLPALLSSREQDWLDVMGSLFAVDQFCARGQEADWNRALRVHVPVREPDMWPPLAAGLSDLFAELTYDDLSLSFYHDPAALPPPRQRRSPFPEFDCVALFSGGVDSFVGACQLVANGRRPALLTHAPGSAIRSATRQLHEEVGALGPLGPSLTLTAQRRGGEPADSTQRSRSLMFLATAAVAAVAGETDEVFINENGVMAVHAPMTAARVGSLSTRTASPSLIDAFSALASSALGRPVRASNLLQTDTKPEVAARGVGLGVGHALVNTISCWSIGRNRRHCGYCAPCLIRRISMESHGIVDTVYDVNPFDGERAAEPTVHDNLVQMLMLAADLANAANEFDIELDYPEVLNAGSAMTIGESLEMHRRWGEQAMAIARSHAYSASLL